MIIFTIRIYINLSTQYKDSINLRNVLFFLFIQNIHTVFSKIQNFFLKISRLYEPTNNGIIISQYSIIHSNLFTEQQYTERMFLYHNKEPAEGTILSDTLYPPS